MKEDKKEWLSLGTEIIKLLTDIITALPVLVSLLLMIISPTKWWGLALFVLPYVIVAFSIMKACKYKKKLIFMDSLAQILNEAYQQDEPIHLDINPGDTEIRLNSGDRLTILTNNLLLEKKETEEISKKLRAGASYIYLFIS